MKNTLLLVAWIGALPFSGTLSLLPAQMRSTGIEAQLLSRYRTARVGLNSVVVRAGSVLVVQQDGITALPAPGEWPCNTYKQGGRIKQEPNACVVKYGKSKDGKRLLQVGEKACLTAIQVEPSEVVLTVQTCGGDANDVPFKAAVSIQFPRRYLDSTNIKPIQDTIDGILAIDAGSPAEGSDPSPAAAPGGSLPLEAGQPPPPPPGTAVMPLKLPSTYVSAQAPADQLQLNADNSFSLQEAGQTYHGTFVVNGNALQLSISEAETNTTVTIQGNGLTDGSGQTWVLREEAPRDAPGEALLRNQDIIKMVKAGLGDTLIIAEIGTSKCQFDTSADALIQLKQSGVSDAVLKAVLGAGK
jgi:hypothetical protein